MFQKNLTDQMMEFYIVT